MENQESPSESQEPEYGPRVWIACLAAYNNGRLHGKWIDATSLDTLEEGRKHVLATSPEPWAEEAAIHDYDGFPRPLPSLLGEYPDYRVLAAIGELLTKLDESDAEAFAAWIENEHGHQLTPDIDEDDFREVYQGVHKSLKDFAEDIYEEMDKEQQGEIARQYFYSGGSEAWARDLELSGDYWTHDGEHGTHVFRS